MHDSLLIFDTCAFPVVAEMYLKKHSLNGLPWIPTVLMTSTFGEDTCPVFTVPAFLNLLGYITACLKPLITPGMYCCHVADVL